MDMQFGEATPVQQLQRRLFDDAELRAKFNAEWRELYAEGVPMQQAIWQIRDKYLGGE